MPDGGGGAVGVELMPVMPDMMTSHVLKLWQ